MIITTDHGLPLPGMKGTLTEAGTGVLLIMRGPGEFSGGRVCESMVSQIDLFPTLCDLLDLDRPSWLQGRSLLPAVRDGVEVNEAVFTESTYHVSYQPQRCVRTPRWSLITDFGDWREPRLANVDDSASKTRVGSRRLGEPALAGRATARPAARSAGADQPDRRPGVRRGAGRPAASSGRLDGAHRRSVAPRSGAGAGTSAAARRRAVAPRTQIEPADALLPPPTSCRDASGDGRECASLVDRVRRMSYTAADDRYDVQPYRRCGRSGLQLPAVSLGFWHNFGDDKPLETQRAIMRRAFDLGVTHFDLANNYGPPYGSAESNVGRILAEDFAALPRRAGDLHQGRLGHVARPVRQPRLAQVPDRQPRPVAAAARARLRRHLLPPPTRPGHAAGGDDGGAGLDRPGGQGALRRGLLLFRPSTPPRRPRSCATSAPRC